MGKEFDIDKFIDNLDKEMTSEELEKILEHNKKPFGHKKPKKYKGDFHD